jgi:GTP-binding protein Era
MMASVKTALEDADLALLIVDADENLEEVDAIFQGLRLRVPALVVLNKIDAAGNGKIAQAEAFFAGKPYCKQLVKISALQNVHLNKLLDAILALLPEGDPFYSEDDLSDLPTKFFVSEMMREKIYQLYGDEIPYHAAVMVNEYQRERHAGKNTGRYHREPGNPESHYYRRQGQNDQTTGHDGKAGY